VELTDIEMFLTLSEELHFARTATRMSVSPARVSQRIRAFEEHVGAPLFERTSRRVRPTPLGADLHSRLRPLYDELRAVIARAQTDAGGSTATLRIGFTALACGHALNRLVRAFEIRNPGYQVVLREINMDDPFESLRSDTIDLLITWWLGSVPGLVDGPVLDEQPRVLAVAADHPVAGHGTVSVEALADYPVLGGATVCVPPQRGDTTPAGRPIRLSTITVRTPGEASSQIARGQAVLPTLASFAALVDGADIVLVPIHDLSSATLRLLWRPAARLDAGIRGLAELVQTTRV
jgi:DNA-binding transcriptional LysR family regulator